ncbi:MAG: ParB N-terminal domain-containing protein, partial [Oscillibacter sp.]|nr:ParB N-terminal domain-containing protein [Oscillibacter sp.]
MAANSEKTAVGLRNIPLNQLYPHPDNPRKDLGDLSELAESIKVNGIFQNLTAVPA